jgi:putative restriction endonuclease
MKFYLGVTDNNWFKYLSSINPEDINFWQPGGSVTFKVLQSGAPFLFKLKSPINAIGGIGFFSSHSFLPLSIAWDAFGKRNGCETFDEFNSLILNYRKDKFNLNPTIGCIVLNNPIFFEESDWIETPDNWANSIVQGKSYDTNEEVGHILWQKVEKLLEKYLYNSQESNSHLIINEPENRYGNSFSNKIRIGQGAFRVLVTDV